MTGSFATGTLGRSAATIARNVGAAAEPVVGPNQPTLADCAASDTASVPALVTADPATVKTVGIVKPTLVTVPAGIGLSVYLAAALSHATAYPFVPDPLLFV